MKNYYEILEVDKKASLDIIKKIYKLKIKRTHPDLFTGEEKIKAERETKLLNEAYSILSDENKRKEYDKILEQDINNSELLKEENKILKEQIVYLNNMIDKKNFILSYFLSENEINDINKTLEQYGYTPNKANLEDNSDEANNENTPLLKSLFDNLLYTILDIFFNPFIFMIIIIIIVFIVSLKFK